MKPPLRTKTLSTKVSEEELAQLEAAASERGLTPSEWCRETLLASVNGQEPKASDPGGTGHAVMAELVALRAILLNVLFKQANGQTLTAEEMQRLIDRADSDKAEEGAGAALACARARRATERKILIVFSWFRVPNKE